MSTILGLLPILLFFIFPILSNLFSGEADVSRAPHVVFDQPAGIYTAERTMPEFKQKYFVNPADISNYSPAKLKKMDERVEVHFINKLSDECRVEMHDQNRIIDEANGWFSRDEAKIKLAKEMDLKACNRMTKLGLRRPQM